VASQDGYTEGSLQSWSIGQSGVISGTSPTASLSSWNPRPRQLLQPGGLENLGNLQYRRRQLSGAPETGTPGSAGRGTLLGGALEQSNVDLANS